MQRGTVGFPEPGILSWNLPYITLLCHNCILHYEVTRQLSTREVKQSGLLFPFYPSGEIILGAYPPLLCTGVTCLVEHAQTPTLFQFLIAISLGHQVPKGYPGFSYFISLESGECIGPFVERQVPYRQPKHSTVKLSNADS
jgi:hypothetical protein